MESVNNLGLEGPLGHLVPPAADPNAEDREEG